MNSTLHDQDWPRIIKELTIYAYSRLRFWGLVKNKRIKGNTAKDVAINAIEAVLSGKWNWDSNKSDLLSYLKFHVVRGMVANLARDPEVKRSSDVELSEVNVESEFSQEDEYNSTLVMSQIFDVVKDDQLLSEITDLLSQGMKRKDVCKELSIDLSMYDNALKRLRTRILKLEKAGILKRSV